MKTSILILLFLAFTCGCNSDNESFDKKEGEVLLLIVDYKTNTFDGGTEFIFNHHPDIFTVEMEYVPPGDFGYVKLKFKELNELLFDGTIHWMGEGKMKYPTNILPGDEFKFTDTADFVKPINGFEEIKTFHNNDFEYNNPWITVQKMVKVRDYLSINPSQKVKIFLYTPSVGNGDPTNWKWIVLMYK